MKEKQNMKFVITKRKNWAGQYELESIYIASENANIYIEGEDMKEFLSVLDGKKQVFQSELDGFIPQKMTLVSEK